MHDDAAPDRLNGNYHFTVGAFECWAVSAGQWTYPARAFFANAPAEARAAALVRHGLSASLTTPFNSLLIDTGRERILVDTGLERAGSAETLSANLRQLGLTPADVDTVFLTHGHADHIGAITDRNGQPTFPNARYVLSLLEWDYWFSGAAAARLGADHAGAVCRQLGAVLDRVELVAGEAEIAAGMRAVPAPGHTPGNLLLTLEAQGQRLWALADVLANPIHAEHPDWTIVSDSDPAQAVETRRRILAGAAADGALVFAYHCPFPGLGTLHPLGKNWIWRRLD